LLSTGVAPLRVVRVSVDGWRANRLGTLYEYVTRVATTSVGDAPRYWFLDEVTAVEGSWWSVLKDLRDNTGLRDACVVLTGSSNRGLDDAIKALEEAMKGDDKAEIDAKVQALSEASAGLAQKLYAEQAQAGDGAQQEPGGGDARADDEGVVDAEFEEVNDKDKNEGR
jgi:hypothetical protein